jgi:hypothetical protein
MKQSLSMLLESRIFDHAGHECNRLLLCRCRLAKRAAGPIDVVGADRGAL